MPEADNLKGLHNKLFFLLSLISAMGFATAGSIVHLALSATAIPDSYVEAVSAAGLYKGAVLRTGAYVFLALAALMAAAAAFVSVRYSHRVAGPLFRLRETARRMEREGAEFSIRENDSVQGLAHAVGEINRKYRAMGSSVVAGLDDVAEMVSELEKAAKDCDRERLRGNIDSLKVRLSEIEGILAGPRT